MSRSDLTGYTKPRFEEDQDVDLGVDLGQDANDKAEWIALMGQDANDKAEWIALLVDDGGGAVKDDTDKVRVELFPGDALLAISDILTSGAKKYEDRNWEKGMKWSRPFGALMRHMWAWWQGEKLDAETGKSHLWHAGCCIVFLIAYEIRGIGLDDRP